MLRAAANILPQSGMLGVFFTINDKDQVFCYPYIVLALFSDIL